MAHKWARWLHNPYCLGGPHRFRAGGQIQKWPTSGQGGYITPTAWGVPGASERGRIRCGPQVWKVATYPYRWGGLTASERRAESKVAHKLARWLHNPCRLGGPHRFRAGHNQKWPTSGQRGYITLAVWGVPTTLERGAESEVTHKWARWLHNPCCLGGAHRFRAGGADSEVAHKWARWVHNSCCLGGPHRCRAGGKIRSDPQMGKVAA